MGIEDLKVDQEWTLFLDRDGVINEKLEGDYVKRVEEFRFIAGAKEAIAKFTSIFKRIVIVTNQQGIGKGLMTVEDLEAVHGMMLKEIEAAGGRIDAIYYCPELAEKNATCRKPNIGMVESAKEKFPEIEFKKSIMVGDSLSDLEMGKRATMTTVYISAESSLPTNADFMLSSLKELASKI